jgi:hypothetical protein
VTLIRNSAKAAATVMALETHPNGPSHLSGRRK